MNKWMDMAQTSPQNWKHRGRWIASLLFARVINKLPLSCTYYNISTNLSQKFPSEYVAYPSLRFLGKGKVRTIIPTQNSCLDFILISSFPFIGTSFKVLLLFFLGVVGKEATPLIAQGLPQVWRLLLKMLWNLQISRDLKHTLNLLNSLQPISLLDLGGGGTTSHT